MAAPLQVPLACSVKVTVPLAGPPPLRVTVAESFGRQVWAVAVVEVSTTRKHSAAELASADGR